MSYLPMLLTNKEVFPGGTYVDGVQDALKYLFDAFQRSFEETEKFARAEPVPHAGCTGSEFQQILAGHYGKQAKIIQSMKEFILG